MRYKGWIRLHRKIMADPMWLAEPFTRAQAWVDLLILANHTDGYIRKRGIRIDLKRGDVGWSQLELAKRWRWSRGKVKRFLSELCSGNDPKMIQQNEHQNIKITSHYSIINYERYQSDGQQNEHQTDIKRYRNKNDKNDKKKTPDFFSLKNRYPNQNLIDQVFQAIASTRKYGKVSDNILHNQLERWAKCPVEIVEAGIRIYLDKDYAGQGKRENYLLGIINSLNGDKSQQQRKTPCSIPKQQLEILTPEKIKEMQDAN